MSIKTTWGYTITGADALTNFLTVEEFNAFTNGKFTGDARVPVNIPAATRAIQNYCGWHIYPNVACEMAFNIRDLRDAFVGADLLIQLPSRMVTGVTSVLLNAHQEDNTWTGIETTDYDLQESGLLKIFDVPCLDRRAKIRIVFNSGLTAEQMSTLKELTAYRVTHAVSSSYGITSEAAGGVSVTYNAAWAGNSRSTALPDDNKEALEPYAVRGVF